MSNEIIELSGFVSENSLPMLVTSYIFPSMTIFTSYVICDTAKIVPLLTDNACVFAFLLFIIIVVLINLHSLILSINIVIDKLCLIYTDSQPFSSSQCKMLVDYITMQCYFLNQHCPKLHGSDDKFNLSNIITQHVFIIFKLKIWQYEHSSISDQVLIVV